MIDRIDRRYLRLVLALATLAVASGTLAALPAAQEKDAALEGKWHAVSITERGRQKSDDSVKLMTFEFKDGKMNLTMLDKSKSFTFRPDPGKTPKQFDMVDERNRTLPGIYKIDKDTLTLCFDPAGDGRPEKFEVPENSRAVLIVLKRGEVQLDPKAAKELGEKLKETADRIVSQNNLKQIALAMHNYHDVHKHLPPGAITDKQGKPLLSWRVAILPYVEQNELYQQFKLDEPWDSAHNKKLLEKMPKLYAPVRGQPKEPHSTHYQVFNGPGAMFHGDKAMTFQQITDGTSNTIMVAEAFEAVPWTKPADLNYDPKAPLPRLGGMFKDVFHVAFADGSVRAVRRQFNADMFRLFITIADGQVVDFDKLAP